ncbi:MAG: GNAT family N-acetyltransferase [Acidimicrobiales bacterium]|nr:GNAT family N-acetyltransferase [Acidimicrobiales bacterium]
MTISQGDSTAITVGLATSADLDDLWGLLDDAARWMTERGIDQWPDPFPRDLLAGSVHRQETYTARQADQLVGTIALYREDERFWGHRPPDALYVHRLCVARDRAGRGLGAVLLEWAGRQAHAQRRSWLRLDTGAGNTKLRSFYENLGFIHQGDICVHIPSAGRFDRPWNAALYQRPVSARTGVGP